MNMTLWNKATVTFCVVLECTAMHSEDWVIWAWIFQNMGLSVQLKLFISPFIPFPSWLLAIFTSHIVWVHSHVTVHTYLTLKHAVCECCGVHMYSLLQVGSLRSHVPSGRQVLKGGQFSEYVGLHL